MKEKKYRFECIECHKQYKSIKWATKHQISKGHGAMTEVNLWENVSDIKETIAQHID